MPFSHYCRLIACLLQHFREEGFGGIDALCQHALSVLMTVEAGHQAGTAWCRKRVFNKSLVEFHSPFCKSVDIWGRRQLGDGTAVGADSLYGVVIAHDIQDVWFFACILGEER